MDNRIIKVFAAFVMMTLCVSVLLFVINDYTNDSALSNDEYIMSEYITENCLAIDDNNINETVVFTYMPTSNATKVIVN